MHVPRFNSILFSVTEGCHVGCAHCGFIGSTRDRETDAGELSDWVSQACVYGIPIIIFTGGEPFERFPVLRQGVAAAAAHRVPSAVFTSSFWATSAEVATSTLRELPGLSHLYLSTDVYHQRRVPYEHVWHVIDAADALGIAHISLCLTYSNEQDRLDVRRAYAQYGDRVFFRESRVIPTQFIGRALKGSDPGLDVVEDNFKSTCWVDTPIVNPNGDLCACHVGKVGAHVRARDLPYWLGNLRELSFQAIMEAAHSNLPYQYLRTHGPKGIARLFRAFPDLAASVGRTQFTGPCDLCSATLFNAEGMRRLREYVQRPEVIRQINVQLALRFKELPIEPVPDEPVAMAAVADRVAAPRA